MNQNDELIKENMRFRKDNEKFKGELVHVKAQREQQAQVYQNQFHSLNEQIQELHQKLGEKTELKDIALLDLSRSQEEVKRMRTEKKTLEDELSKAN